MRLSTFYGCFLVLALLVLGSCASNRRPALNHGQSSYSQSSPSSRTSGAEAGSASARATRQGSKKSRGGSSTFKSHEQMVEEYEELMKDNARRYRREAKLAQKPQYSDPSYFGHKRKPKKRPVGKRKFCKECQIVH